jgi:ADP-ribosyl-[dinitrogen reductase] hydrolase
VADLVARYQGCLLGLAVGDALGTTLEFTPPGRGGAPPLTTIVGGGPFGLPAGAWTDDTSMALCLAESLVACHGFDARDQMERYVRWWRDGENSSTGRCFDIGNATAAALRRYVEDGDPYAGSADPHQAGNGSLMRLAPVVLWFAGDPARAEEMAAASSRTTHAAVEAVDACRYAARLLVRALAGAPKATLLSTPGDDLAPAVAAVAAGSYRDGEPPAIRGTGYVVRSLEAALWAFHRADSFRDGALAAVNLGEDADTTGAIYGQIAGAHYRADGIPADWLAALHERDRLRRLATALHDRRPVASPPRRGRPTGSRARRAC